MTNTKKIKFTTLVLSVCMLAALWLMDSKYGEGILFRGTEPFRFGTTPSYTFHSIVEKLLVLTVFSCGVLLLSFLTKKKDGVFGNDRRMLQLVAIMPRLRNSAILRETFIRLTPKISASDSWVSSCQKFC